LKENGELQLLYGKYIDNQLSAEEIRNLLISLADISEQDLNQLTSGVLFEPIAIAENNEQEDQSLQKILTGIKLKQQIPVRPFQRKLYTWLSSAAAAVLIFGSLIYFTKEDSLEKQAAVADLQPGKNKAILTLGNGNHITLDDAASGELATQGGVQISKTKEGIVYRVTQGARTSNEQNTIETPKGAQYMLILPDESKVWLNAGSSLKYPVSFTAAKNRMVTLTGEAYFEVTKEPAHPFIVRTDKQEVQVLGTHFNISSYSDEPATLTTLLEGSVRVSKTGTEKIIKPGEQAIADIRGIQTTAVNVEEVMAWKNGYFRFNDEKIESIMRKIARWYDVEVEFKGEISQEEYNGKISRFKNIAQVLDMLSSTNTVHFKIEGRRILVIK